MMHVKMDFFNLWKKGKKRFEEKEIIETWTTVEWDTFEYLGPRGMDVSFLRPGSLENDENEVDMQAARVQGRSSNPTSGGSTRMLRLPM